MVAHSSLTGADLHEPKGVAGATSDTVYVANGAGSGTWSKLPLDAADVTEFDSRYALASELDTLSSFLFRGSGSPEGVVTANIGSVFLRTDGSTNTTLYVKESGTGNTGWVAK